MPPLYWCQSANWVCMPDWLQASLDSLESSVLSCRMSSGTADRISAPASGDHPLQTPFAASFQSCVSDDPSDAGHAAAHNSAAGATAAAASAASVALQPPADRTSSTTALLAGHGPTSSLKPPNPAPIQAVDDLLDEVATTIKDEAQANMGVAQRQAAATISNVDGGIGSPPPVSRSQSGRKKKLIPLRQVNGLMTLAGHPRTLQDMLFHFLCLYSLTVASSLFSNSGDQCCYASVMRCRRLGITALQQALALQLQTSCQVVIFRASPAARDIMPTAYGAIHPGTSGLI